jgi:hypothetical protein
LPKPCIRKSSIPFFLTILAGALFFLTLSGQAGEKVMPFSIGEKLHYTVSWEMISAGKATFRVLPLTTVNGEKACHFLLEVRSNRYIDMLYKIRDRLEGFTDLGVSQSLLHKKTQSGKDKREVMVRFDWETKTARYSNFGEKREPIKIPLNTVDPISAFYKMRALTFKTGQTISFPVTDGKKHFIQTGEVMKKEAITLPSGTFDTYLLALQVNHFSGVFKKSENPTVTLWVTTDERRIPVRIKIKVYIGSVIFDLVSAN